MLQVRLITCAPADIHSIDRMPHSHPHQRCGSALGDLSSAAAHMEAKMMACRARASACQFVIRLSEVIRPSLFAFIFIPNLLWGCVFDSIERCPSPSSQMALTDGSALTPADDAYSKRAKHKARGKEASRALYNYPLHFPRHAFIPPS